MASAEVAVVGMGKFGARLIAPLYFAGAIQGARLGALIDRDGRKVTSPAIQGEIQQLRTIGEWRPHDSSTAVVDAVVPPSDVPDVLESALALGVRRFILHKPGASTSEGLERIVELLRSTKAHAAMASNWFYSDMPKQVALALKDAMRSGRRIRHVELSYSKQRESIADVTPALSELPHALQILVSCGLAHEKNLSPIVVFASRSKLVVTLELPGVLELARVTVDLLRFPGEPRRIERKLEVTFDGSDEPDLEADFGMQFNQDRQCVQDGHLMLRTADQPQVRQVFQENTLDIMYNRMFAGLLASEPDHYLTLQAYAPITVAAVESNRQWMGWL